ncbi:MAG: hypothetical protein M3527_03685 [Actinomycetota bacterium]|nr:hypothetical protein [Acidimicrobiia bacterium]MDQ3293537.1 hypothetical protein [Actinomycetota bacterium]
MRPILGPVLVGLALAAGCVAEETAVTPAETGTVPVAPSAGETSTTSTVPPPAPAPVRGLLATIGTNRLYAPQRELGLGLRNVSDAPVAVTGVQLESSLFAAVPVTDDPVLLPAAFRRLVLRLPYGPARCDGEADPALVAVVRFEDGQELRLPAVEDYPGGIARLHDRECAAAEVLARADIRFGDVWVRDGVAISGELLVDQRTPGPAVNVADASGNVIFTLRVDDRSPVVAVTDDEPSARAPITISADRCDPHAVAEFKRPMVFLAWVALGDAEAVPVELEAAGPARAALEALLATCRP